MKGKFIVIEGGDATGKTTQVELLKKYLKKIRLKTLVLDFPRYYDNFWGEMVGTYLRGEFGGLYENNPYLSTLPYILDQSDAKRAIKKALKTGSIVLSNRYITSQVHQCSKLPLDKRDKYIKWLDEAAYQKLGAVKADIVIVLHIPSKKSNNLNNNKSERNYINGRINDIAEASLKHQQEAREEYKRWAAARPNWELLICTDKNGKLQTPEVIHEKILGILQNKGILGSVTALDQLCMFTE